MLRIERHSVDARSVDGGMAVSHTCSACLALCVFVPRRPVFSDSLGPHGL